MPVLVPASVTFKRILVATDFSPCSEAILPFAKNVAREYGSTIFLAHVIPSAVLSVDPTALEAAEAVATRQMDQLEVEQFAGVPHERIVEEGDPWAVLSRIMEQRDIDLIIVGTHGRTGFNRLIMGSVAEDIFRHAPCPVLTIGPRVRIEGKHEGQITHVLFATDLRAETPGPIEFAVSLAHQHKAHLTLMHVAETNSHLPVPQALLDMVPAEVDLWCTPEAVIEIGDAAEKILQVAAARHADLIVMGAHRPAILTTHLMDVAYKVVCEAPCPVLTVGAGFQG